MIQKIKVSYIKKIVFFSIFLFIIFFYNKVEAKIECVNNETIKIGVGQTKHLAYVENSNPKEDVNWKSSDNYIVTVSKYGKIIGKHTGKAIIKAGDFQCTINVIEKERKIEIIDGCRVLYPDNYDKSKKYSIYVYFRGIDGGKVNTRNSLIENLICSDKKNDYIIIEPENYGKAWSPNLVKSAYNSLSNIKNKINNNNNVDIMGFSGGCSGVLDFIVLNKNKSDGNNSKIKKASVISIGTKNIPNGIKDAIREQEIDFNNYVNFGDNIGNKRNVLNLKNEIGDQCNTYIINTSEGHGCFDLMSQEKFSN